MIGHQLIPAQTYFNTIKYDWSSSCHPVGLWPGEEHYSVFATTRKISRCFFPLLADTVLIIVSTPLSNCLLPVSILLPNERSGVNSNTLYTVILFKFNRPGLRKCLSICLHPDSSRSSTTSSTPKSHNH